MVPKRQPWKVLDKRRFLNAAMAELAGAAHISFEGNLSSLRLFLLPGVSKDETLILKRNTIWPKQDFVVVPLEADLMKAIGSAVGGTVPKAILHIQIEKQGGLEFGVYDNFQHIVIGSAVSSQFCEKLLKDEIVRNVQLPLR